MEDIKIIINNTNTYTMKLYLKKKTKVLDFLLINIDWIYICLFAGPVQNSIEVSPRKMSVREGESVIVPCRTTGAQFDLRWSKERSREVVNTVVSITLIMKKNNDYSNFLTTHCLLEYSWRACFEDRQSRCARHRHIQMFRPWSNWFAKIWRFLTHSPNW